MHKKLAIATHSLVLTSIITIVAVFILSNVDSYDYSRELGYSLLYGLIYFCALVIGFVGWILSITLLIRERHNRTRHSVYAAAYFIIGIIGFGWAYYLMQAS